MSVRHVIQHLYQNDIQHPCTIKSFNLWDQYTNYQFPRSIVTLIILIWPHHIFDYANPEDCDELDLLDQIFQWQSSMWHKLHSRNRSQLRIFGICGVLGHKYCKHIHVNSQKSISLLRFMTVMPGYTYMITWLRHLVSLSIGKYSLSEFRACVSNIIHVLEGLNTRPFLISMLNYQTNLQVRALHISYILYFYLDVITYMI